MKNYIYIKYNAYYTDNNGNKHYYSNRLLTVGILRKFLGFKLFLNINL